MRSFKHIAQLVRNNRLSHPKRYSQSELSKALGYKNGQFISNVERGLCSIPLKGLAKLSEILNVSSEEIKQAMLDDYLETIESHMSNPEQYTSESNGGELAQA